MNHYQLRKAGLMLSATYSARICPWLMEYPRICIELQSAYEKMQQMQARAR